MSQSKWLGQNISPFVEEKIPTAAGQQQINDQAGQLLQPQPLQPQFQSSLRYVEQPAQILSASGAFQQPQTLITGPQQQQQIRVVPLSVPGPHMVGILI